MDGFPEHHIWLQELVFLMVALNIIYMHNGDIQYWGYNQLQQWLGKCCGAVWCTIDHHSFVSRGYHLGFSIFSQNWDPTNSMVPNWEFIMLDDYWGPRSPIFENTYFEASLTQLAVVEWTNHQEKDVCRDPVTPLRAPTWIKPEFGHQ